MASAVLDVNSNDRGQSSAPARKSPLIQVIKTFRQQHLNIIVCLKRRI